MRWTVIGTPRAPARLEPNLDMVVDRKALYRLFIPSAKRALGCATTRATVEEALRRAAAHAHDQRAARQQRYLQRLVDHVDV
ncbi:hypothetical protein K3U93_03270 [Mycobacterium malmoense]|uniref:hypothetical protein n=1 Tax=Mycobacterium malmoense TaxID=1780 RepID=UPI00111BFA4A|nr:hypothetical protein [Mycobacterium malmoense]QZA18247.1 hypothetical protein K3U93_03270 [Mycobacterium malmoense]UNB95020.1 hypothetical protein H5T25_03265 [Mycobacterium malmoense]